MLNAALAQGKPIMVIAMTTAAITQPNAIHKPPKTIQSRLRRMEMTDIATRRPTTTRLTAGAGPATPVTAARSAGSRATTRRRRRHDQWHRAKHAVKRYVAEHARNDVARRAELVGLVHDEQRQRRGDDVADDGKEPNQRIEAEAHAGAGDDERGVKQGRKRVEPGDAGATGAGAHQVEAKAIRGGHSGRPSRPR